MKEDITRMVANCSKCGQPYIRYRGVSGTRCESCWEDRDIKWDHESNCGQKNDHS